MTKTRNVEEYVRRIETIPGWFYSDDVALFRKLNELQQDSGLTGDLLEIGVFEGKSAILLGYFLAQGERLVLCDNFQQGEGVRERLETRWRAYHDQLPEILMHSSTRLDAEKLGKTFRLIHIDGSHDYAMVKSDIQLARETIKDGGIIIFDDYMHTGFPGVAAAVWEEITSGGLTPFVLTQMKLYASYQHPAWFGQLLEWCYYEAWDHRFARTEVDILLRRQPAIKVTCGNVPPPPADLPRRLYAKLKSFFKT